MALDRLRDFTGTVSTSDLVGPADFFGFGYGVAAGGSGLVSDSRVLISLSLFLYK